MGFGRVSRSWRLPLKISRRWGDSPQGSETGLPTWQGRCAAGMSGSACQTVHAVQRKDTEGKPLRDFDVIVSARPHAVCTLGFGGQ